MQGVWEAPWPRPHHSSRLGCLELAPLSVCSSCPSPPPHWVAHCYCYSGRCLFSHGSSLVTCLVTSPLGQHGISLLQEMHLPRLSDLSHPALGRGHPEGSRMGMASSVGMNAWPLLGEAASAHEGAQGKLPDLLGSRCPYRPQETLSSLRLK